MRSEKLHAFLVGQLSCRPMTGITWGDTSFFVEIALRFSGGDVLIRIRKRDWLDCLFVGLLLTCMQEIKDIQQFNMNPPPT